MASTSQNTTTERLEEQQQKLDLAITLALNTWPALTLAVQSSWGGQNSSDKRDWLCGAISDIISTRPETDSYDIEDILVQVMTDEFDVAVDDGSAGIVADQIMNLKARIDLGDYADVDRMWAEYKDKMERKGVEQQNLFRHVDTKDEDQETDEDVDDDEDEDEEMNDAPTLVSRPPRQRAEPEVDEEGFTKVVDHKMHSLTPSPQPTPVHLTYSHVEYLGAVFPPAYLAPDVVVRVETFGLGGGGRRVNQGVVKLQGRFSSDRDNLAQAWYITKELETRFYIEGGKDRSSDDGLAAVMVYGKIDQES
ncbi:pre-rRNA processing protein, putative [Talaromyces stipitatus ATCC 10500]|uniref:Pre-rRNA processing protein, putative n=1 Tax=Talaromyces stipitatus (strain ATCC 10500 / CBS 375.48 / QM 6759 / NRRL 1006) TaxID=441959 RepID=B8M071_TALSN|nr:pre-rRNA processing protein, putative [Talaromyces stipitatus ATCC 10500]EED21168.1 pre-rRNA processing protein, putative [Talaromyces stipitatus ATCC 10500]